MGSEEWGGMKKRGERRGGMKKRGERRGGMKKRGEGRGERGAVTVEETGLHNKLTKWYRSIPPAANSST